MTAPHVRSAFDVAFWLLDQALNHNEYLQPQKVQRLLYLAQGYYAVAYSGQALMPAVFVAEEMGPVEPNVFMAFSRGRPDIDLDMVLPQQVEMFLESIWRKFGHHSVDYLNRLCKETQCYQKARLNGRGRIKLADMRDAFTKGDKTPGVGQVVRSKIMRSHTGRAVAVKSWLPGLKQAPGKAKSNVG